MIKRLTAFLGFALLIVTLCVSSGQVLAAPYNEGIYGDGDYSADSTTSSGTSSSSAAKKPTSSSVSSTTSTDNKTVSADADKDGNQEQAIDADGNTANGYEQFVDPDGSSVVLTVVYDANGMAAFILDTDRDGQPDIYWAPSSGYISTVVVERDNKGTAWVYIDATGLIKRYQFSDQGAVEEDKPTTTSTTPQKSRRITGDGFGGGLYRGLGGLATKFPKLLAYAFPYLLLLTFGLLIVLLILLAKRNANRIEAMRAVMEQQKQAAFEKQGLLTLSARDVQTPLGSFRNNVRMLQSLGSITGDVARRLDSLVADMLGRVENLLARFEDRQFASSVAYQSAPMSAAHYWFSPLVLLPFITIVFLMLLAHFVFIDFRVTSPNIIDFLVQIGLLVLLMQLFVSNFRRYQIQKQTRLEQQRLMQDQQAFYEGREQLTTDALQTLNSGVTSLGGEIDTLASKGTDVTKLRVDYSQFKDAAGRFSAASS